MIPSLPVSWSWGICLLPWIGIYTIDSPDSINFWLVLNYTSSFPGCPACRQQIMGLLSLHNLRNQFYRIYLFISIYLSTYLSTIYPSIHLSIYPSIHHSYLSTHHICLSIIYLYLNNLICKVGILLVTTPWWTLLSSIVNITQVLLLAFVSL